MRIGNDISERECVTLAQTPRNCLLELNNNFNVTIIALDPAGPWFDVAAATNRISKTDAKFVDIIHTNSGTLFNVSLRNNIQFFNYHKNA